MLRWKFTFEIHENKLLFSSFDAKFLDAEEFSRICLLCKSNLSSKYVHPTKRCFYKFYLKLNELFSSYHDLSQDVTLSKILNLTKPRFPCNVRICKNQAAKLKQKLYNSPLQGRHQGKMLKGAKQPQRSGSRAPWWGSGDKVPWSWCLWSVKIMIEALPEHVFPC